MDPELPTKKRSRHPLPAFIFSLISQGRSTNHFCFSYAQEDLLHRRSGRKKSGVESTKRCLEPASFSQGSTGGGLASVKWAKGNAKSLHWGLDQSQKSGKPPISKQSLLIRQMSQECLKIRQQMTHLSQHPFSNSFWEIHTGDKGNTLPLLFSPTHTHTQRYSEIECL